MTQGKGKSWSHRTHRGKESHLATGREGEKVEWQEDRGTQQLRAVLIGDLSLS